jgi:hypothetical protein
MKQDTERFVGPAVRPTRAAAPRFILVAIALLGHAALVLAGVFEAAPWVPILECAVVCVIGLVHLRQLAEESEPAADTPVAAPVSTSYPQPIVPGRVAPPLDAGDRVPGT